MLVQNILANYTIKNNLIIKNFKFTITNGLTASNLAKTLKRKRFIDVIQNKL